MPNSILLTSFSAEKIGLYQSHLVPEIIWPKNWWNFSAKSVKHFSPWFLILLPPPPFFLLFLDLYNPLFFQNLRSHWVHFFIMHWSPLPQSQWCMTTTPGLQQEVTFMCLVLTYVIYPNSIVLYENKPFMTFIINIFQWDMSKNHFLPFPVWKKKFFSPPPTPLIKKSNPWNFLKNTTPPPTSIKWPLPEQGGVLLITEKSVYS